MPPANFDASPRPASQDAADIAKLADWLDARFSIPGTPFRFGFDSIIGLVPGVGDGLSAALGAYIIYRARELGAPPLLLARMAGNLAVDSIVGAIPLIGDVFDIAFKANKKNIDLLRRHLERVSRDAPGDHPPRRDHPLPAREWRSRR